jgi:signal peptidase II
MQAEAGTTLTPESDDHQGAGDRPTGRPRLFWLVIGVAAVWIALDQVTKAVAEQSLTRGDPVPVLGELLQLRLIYNSGAAFSLATGATGLLTILAVSVVAYIIWSARKLGSKGWAWGLGLLLGGAAGNLTDRLLRDPGFGKGHVVDFIALPNFPVFNVADIGITSAAILIGYHALRGINPDGTRAGDQHD